MPLHLPLHLPSPFRPTAGYGNTGPQRCWAAAWMICIQAITNLLLNAIVLGIIFAKARQGSQQRPPVASCQLPCC